MLGLSRETGLLKPRGGLFILTVFCSYTDVLWNIPFPVSQMALLSLVINAHIWSSHLLYGKFWDVCDAQEVRFLAPTPWIHVQMLISILRSQFIDDRRAHFC